MSGAKRKICSEVFFIKDALDLTPAQLLTEARDSAQRRAYVLGWEVLDVTPYGGVFHLKNQPPPQHPPSHPFVLIYQKLS